MNWFNFLPLNKYTYIGLALLILGFLTLPLIIGLFIMPIGAAVLVFGVHKIFFDLGKWVYNIYGKFKPKK